VKDDNRSTTKNEESSSRGENLEQLGVGASSLAEGLKFARA